MQKNERWLHHSANITVGISGLIYFYMLYVIEPAEMDDFSVLNHPYQNLILNIHILTAPFLIFAVAYTAKSHILAKVKKRYKGPGRRSGLLMVTLFVPMVISAYIMQTTSNEGLKQVMVYTHNTTSIFWVLTYIIHQARMIRE